MVKMVGFILDCHRNSRPYFKIYFNEQLNMNTDHGWIIQCIVNFIETVQQKRLLSK